MSLKIHIFTFNAFSENTYILSDETNECVIIDAGCYEREEEQELLNYLKDNQLKPIMLANTHCHIDHVFGVDFLKRTLKIPYLIPEGELGMNNASNMFARMWGFSKVAVPEPDKFLDKEKGLSFGKTHLQILSVPGHSPDHVAFYHAESKVCINGDVLFRQSIGRTDLPNGDHATLIKSIKEVMFQLPDDTIVYCGHGGETTIGYEKKFNPFVRG
jgi:glyoxylase-like metal-dependent hydrolase (beta-lactamase superfamily II)